MGALLRTPSTQSPDRLDDDIMRQHMDFGTPLAPPGAACLAEPPCGTNPFSAQGVAPPGLSLPTKALMGQNPLLGPRNRDPKSPTSSVAGKPPAGAHCGISLSRPTSSRTPETGRYHIYEPSTTVVGGPPIDHLQTPQTSS
jgi:hypothetical protein